MYTRLNDIPVYEYRYGSLSALHFNHVQVALKRIDDSIRFPIPKLKHLDLILQNDAWIIVDRVLNDMPVAAWTDFNHASSRDNLHLSIDCTIRLYHANAGLILRRTLEAMELVLGELLTEHQIEDECQILTFKPAQ